MPPIQQVGARLRAAARALLRGPPELRPGLPASIPGGAVDEIVIRPSGHVEVVGWSESDARVPPLEVEVNGAAARGCGVFRLPRPDVLAVLPPGARLPGFVHRFAAPPQVERISEVTVSSGGRRVARIERELAVRQPHYANLLEEVNVLHREDIYGVGPPAAEVSEELLALARELPAPVLDFGCGSGALVRALRALGLDARGIELSRPEIRASIAGDVGPFVMLYEGNLPLPFADGQFASVVCSEVLEHIAEYAQAAREIARVSKRALITVPDMSAVPALFPHFVVPWHLLEASHLNFFTQASLEALLRKSFDRVSFSRLGRFEVNGTRAYTSIVAFCERR